MRLLLFSFLLATTALSNALQFLRAASLVSENVSVDRARGVDFAVHRAIDVTAVGLFDATSVVFTAR
jgi:hypothetical protein